MNKYSKLLFVTVSILLAGMVIKGLHSLNKNIFNPKVLIQKQQTEFTKLQNANKQLSQAIADMRDELLERPVDIEAERAKFAKNLETGLTIEKLTPEQKKEYDLYDSTLKWLKKNGIKFYFFEAPNFAKIKNLDEFYKVKRTQNDFMPHKNNGLFEKVFTCPECIEHMKQRHKYDCAYNNGKYTVLKDAKSPFFNVTNGKRLTVNSVPPYLINFFGPCTAMGRYASDAHTIDSYMQKMTKHGIMNHSAGWRNYINDFKLIRNAKFYVNNSMVILITSLNDVLKLALRNNNISYFELSQLFDSPNNYGNCFSH